MQCRRCGFENMPGITSCMRCHTVLAAAAPIRVHPPRAGWKRLYRPLLYRWNRLGDRLSDALTSLLAPLSWATRRTAVFHGLLWAALSILPGLGHSLSGRWRPLRWMWPAWALALASGIFFFGTGAGSLLLGLAVALHVWIICDAGQLRDLFETGRGRLFFILAIYLVLLLYFYRDLQPRIQRNWIQCARLAADLGLDNLRRGDFLIFSPRAYLHAQPQRGDVVLYKVAGNMADNGWAGFRIQSGETVGKILGLPGERLKSKSGILTVTAPNGAVTVYRIEPASALPWELDLQLPPDCYFCLTAGYQIVGAYGNPGVQMRDVYTMLGQVARNGILGRGVMVYQPFWRRAGIANRPFEKISASPAPVNVQGRHVAGNP